MGYHLVVTRTTEPGFWDMVGPLCASRIVRRDIGHPITVEDDDVWVLAMCDCIVVGCSALRKASRGGEFVHTWVSEEHRGNGLHRSMIEERLRAARKAGMRTVRTLASPDAAANCERAGFVKIGMRGRYTKMERGL